MLSILLYYMQKFIKDSISNYNRREKNTFSKCKRLVVLKIIFYLLALL